MGKIIKGPWPAVFDSEVNLLSPKNDLEWVAFDTETTGFKNSDRIVEIGFVVFKNGEILEEWSTLINPQRDVGATNIHGITASMVSTAPIFEDVINDIFRIINNRILTSHNFSFDSRLLAQEFKRANTQGSLGKGFCTMIASRRNLSGTGASLSETCEALGITAEDAHSALGDARMVMQIFPNLLSDEQYVSPAEVDYDLAINPARLLQRTVFTREVNDSLKRIRTFTKKVPFPTSDEKFIAYLLILNMAMEDLIISKEEEGELASWAEDLSISKSAITILHQGYFESFVQAALRDGVITPQEREMIELVGKALNVPVVIPETPQLIQANAENLAIGKRVCFTGKATGLTGETIDREDLEALAAKVGLHPVKSVTKRGCDILVAADESTMSGKAKKARDWGIPVISVQKFITYCTFGK
jgi:DNA polymerase-3 subunit epsilon